jgi:NAD(P)-dependent dehydrogenase (short-subunit alcohol dehydrogenase family)
MRLHLHTTASEVVQGMDLRGRTMLVTGGGAGIGLATACALASAGAKVYIADINEAAGREAVAAFRESHPQAQIEVLRLDLGSLAEVRAFAQDFTRREPKLDVLINNAGIMAPPLGYTVDGFERQFGVNFLGHYLLTRLLEPLLRAAGQARVVCISSIAHRRTDIHYDDIHYRTRPYERWDAYSQSKTACALLAIAVDALWQDRGIRSNTMNPGGSATGLHQYLDEAERRRLGFLDGENKQPDRWRPPEECAATSVWLACSPDLEGRGGAYYENFEEAPPWREDDPMHGVRPYAISRDNALRLWAVAAKMTGLSADTPT